MIFLGDRRSDAAGWPLVGTGRVMVVAGLSLLGCPGDRAPGPARAAPAGSQDGGPRGVSTTSTTTGAAPSGGADRERVEARAAAASGDPGMVAVPAGEFFMGCNADVDDQCDPDEKPGRRIRVSAFRIDKTEVTVAAYRACVQAGGCTAKALATATWSKQIMYCNWDKPGRAQHPINCVTWAHARAYCAWAGKRLPTDVEWEKAARGTDGRRYPWGNQGYAGTAVANIADESAKTEDVGGPFVDGYDDGFVSTSPVGAFSPAGDSPYGAQDMMGNVWEWTSDGNEGGALRNLRGGAWDTGSRSARASNRLSFAGSNRDIGVGFRCAK